MLQNQHGQSHEILQRTRSSSPHSRTAVPLTATRDRTTSQQSLSPEGDRYRNPLSASGSLPAAGRGSGSMQQHQPRSQPASTWNEQSDFIAHYMQALQARPTDPSLHNVLGVALAKQGELDMAVKHYTAALLHDGSFFPAHYNLGRAKYRLGKLEDAVGHYESSLRLHPDDMKTHNSLGIVLAEQGNLEDAIAHFHQAMHIMEKALHMKKVDQKFKAPELEHEFASRRTKQAMMPTRLLILTSMIPNIIGLLSNVYRAYFTGSTAVLDNPLNIKIDGDEQVRSRPAARNMS